VIIGGTNGNESIDINQSGGNRVLISSVLHSVTAGTGCDQLGSVVSCPATQGRVQARMASGDDVVRVNTSTIASTLIGGAGSDRLSGGSAPDSVNGGDGDDFLFGNGGNDRISITSALQWTRRAAREWNAYLAERTNEPER
jgi:Ca2+-binding RTX toxin-like protein